MLFRFYMLMDAEDTFSISIPFESDDRFTCHQKHTSGLQLVDLMGSFPG